MGWRGGSTPPGCAPAGWQSRCSAQAARAQTQGRLRGRNRGLYAEDAGQFHHCSLLSVADAHSAEAQEAAFLGGRGHIRRHLIEPLPEALRRALALDPWWERAVLLGMRASLALGDRAAALRLYRNLEQTLRQELVQVGLSNSSVNLLPVDP